MEASLDAMCKWCSHYTGSSRSALRGHIRRHHLSEWRVNLSKDHDSFQIADVHFQWCYTCELLVLNSSLREHLNTAYHQLRDVEQTPLNEQQIGRPGVQHTALERLDAHPEDSHACSSSVHQMEHVVDELSPGVEFEWGDVLYDDAADDHSVSGLHEMTHDFRDTPDGPSAQGFEASSSSSAHCIGLVEMTR